MASILEQDFVKPVTKEELTSFHNIDRVMFFRLVTNLQRDPEESMKVMALLIWLEQAGRARNLVYNTFPWPDALVNALANEAVQCLQCIQSDEFPSFLMGTEVPLILSLTKGEVSLPFIHHNRLPIIHGIDKIVNEVCVRAFEDIMEQAKQSKGRPDVEYSGGQRMTTPLFPVGFYYSPFPTAVPGFVNYLTNAYGSFHPVPGFAPAGVNPMSVQLGVYDFGVQRQVMKGETGEVMGRLEIGSTSGEGEKSEVEVPDDDRTIFLTFSKGYPVSEKEVRGFFTSKFGDCIEAIHMQEVTAGEQSLYARMVVQPPSSVEKILGGGSKVKFSIYGKHLWGRKYKPRKDKSPPQSPAPSRLRHAKPTAF